MHNKEQKKNKYSQTKKKTQIIHGRDVDAFVD